MKKLLTKLGKGVCLGCGSPWDPTQALANSHGCKDDGVGIYTRCPVCGWCALCDEKVGLREAGDNYQSPQVRPNVRFASWTSGPWVAKALDDNHYVISSEPRACAVAKTAVPTDSAEGEIKANAHLLAKAPELFRVLESCLSYLADLNGCPWITDPGVGGTDMRQRAKALQASAYKAVNEVRS